MCCHVSTAEIQEGKMRAICSEVLPLKPTMLKLPVHYIISLYTKREGMAKQQTKFLHIRVV